MVCQSSIPKTKIYKITIKKIDQRAKPLQELKIKHCIEAIQDFLIIEGKSVKETLLIEFQQYICKQIDTLEWNPPYWQKRQMNTIKAKTFKGKLVSYLEL